MPHRYDLSASRAKIARARIHFDALQGAFRPAIDQYAPYTFRDTQIDKDGWYRVYVTPNEIGERNLGILVGDLVHNLRCALDYIVTALVGGPTDVNHFPIFANEALYKRIAGDQASVISGGPLTGVTDPEAIYLVWGVQPFHRQPDPLDDPLHLVHELSNADKHRVIATAAPESLASHIEIWHNGRVIDDEGGPFPTADWKPGEEKLIRGVRFAEPFPANATYEADVSMMIRFETPAVNKRSIRVPVYPTTLDAMCTAVDEVVTRFERL